MSVEFVQSTDGGSWAVRPKNMASRAMAESNASSQQQQHWCNFTLIVKMDEDDDDVSREVSDDPEVFDDDFQGDQPDELLRDDLRPIYDDGVLDGDDGEDLEDGSQSAPPAADASVPRPPTFSRMKKMESVQTQAKPAGATVTYKCPADGKKIARQSRATLCQKIVPL